MVNRQTPYEVATQKPVEEMSPEEFEAARKLLNELRANAERLMNAADAMMKIQTDRIYFKNAVESLIARYPQNEPLTAKNRSTLIMAFMALMDVFYESAD